MLTRGMMVGLLVLLAQGSAAPSIEPAVAIWYRGGPEGSPRLDDLVTIRAYGFSAIAWPADRARDVEPLRRLAEPIGLAVVTPTGPGRSRGWLDIRTTDVPAREIPARAWLAVADGQRVIAFDGGEHFGTSLVAASGDRAAWVAPALALSREMGANAELIRLLRTGPHVEVDVSPAGGRSGRAPEADQARVVLLEAGRAWVLIAANPGPRDLAVVARVSTFVPYGPWVSLIDGSDMAMVARSSHHEYRATLAPGDARVYVIDKRFDQMPPRTS